MNLNLNYPQREDSNILPNPELTLDYINYAVKNSNPDGLSSDFRKIFSRIQNKISVAIDNNESEVNLEEAEKDLLKKSFEKAKFPAELSKFVVLLEEEINK